MLRDTAAHMTMRRLPAQLPPGWELLAVGCQTASRPMGVLRADGPHQAILVPDPAWVTRYQRSASTMTQAAALAPAYQAWRESQVLAATPDMGWGLARGSMPGVWCVLGNGPGARVPPGADRVLAINGALELAPEADLWMVADALRPTNSWGRVIQEWLARHADAVSRARLVARVTARRDLVERVREVHYYLPCSREHRDVIPDHIAARMPTMVDGMQSLPAAMHIVWWLGATRIMLAGVPQGLPADHLRYYEASDTPIPAGRMAGQIPVAGVRGLVYTTTAHMHAHTEADMMCWWLARQGVQIEDHSGGLIYRFAQGVA